jgi:hypothetical protein
MVTCSEITKMVNKYSDYNKKYFLDELDKADQVDILDNSAYLILAHTLNPISSTDVLEKYLFLITDINNLYREKYRKYNSTALNQYITGYIIFNILSHLNYWTMHPQFEKIKYSIDEPLKYYISIDKKEVNEYVEKYSHYIFNSMTSIVLSLVKMHIGHPALTAIVYNNDRIDAKRMRQINTKNHDYEVILLMLLTDLTTINDRYKNNLLGGK